MDSTIKISSQLKKEIILSLKDILPFMTEDDLNLYIVIIQKSYVKNSDFFKFTTMIIGLLYKINLIADNIHANAENSDFYLEYIYKKNVEALKRGDFEHKLSSLISKLNLIFKNS